MKRLTILVGSCRRHSRLWRAVAALFALIVQNANGSNLANPAMNLPPLRLAIGASYDVGGFSITNDAVPALLNRFHGRISFSPSRFVDAGIDLGTAQMEVDSYQDTNDTIGIFHGQYGFSAAAHVKLRSPFFAGDRLAAVGIGQAGWFSSENKAGALYSGIDGTGAVGLQYRLLDYGYITLGVKAYLIQGTNRGYLDKDSDTQSKYSNNNNIQGWLAIDFLPSFRGGVNGRPYFSFECSAGPGAAAGDRIPLRQASISLAIGWISPRLIGEDYEDIK